jgi:hypothetical protein
MRNYYDFELKIPPLVERFDVSILRWISREEVKKCYFL